MVSTVIGVFGVICIPFTMYAAEIIPGDAVGKTFSFPILENVFHERLSSLYVGAASAINNNNYSIAFANNTTNKFIPMTPSLITLNNEANQKNPLNGAAIQHLALFDRYPIAVIQGNDTSVYMINDFLNFSVISATDFHDATGTQMGHIVGITTDNNGFFEAENGANAIFTALSPVSETFGAPGSGIAFATIQNRIIDKGKKTEKSLPFISVGNANNPALGTNQAAPLDVTSNALTIGADLSAIHNNIVDLHWDEMLGRLYLALQITTSAGVGNGGKAVASARVRGGLVTLESIVSNSAITNDSIIAAQIDAGADISIHKVRTMHTRTRLHYLIVVGGIGKDSATKNLVFALPLVSTQHLSNISGLLAKQDSDPVDIFFGNLPSRFGSRTLPVPATAVGDLPTMHDPAAMIGAGQAPGDIRSLTVVGDAVFITIMSSTTHEQPGIFHSQAIFDAKGKIKRWTPWRRAAGTAQGSIGCALDAFTGNVWYINQHDDSSSTVFRTQWQLNTPLATLVNSWFKSVQGGVQGLIDFPKESPGLTQEVGLRTSLLIASGNHTCLMIQTGADNESNQFGPITDFNATFVSNDGTLKDFIPGVYSLALRGGSLDTIGSIVSATIATDGTQSWLVVGGSHGVAVLADNDGSGALSGFVDGFSSLRPTMKFRKIGNYTDIISVYGDGTNLYILTPTTLDRLPVSTDTFAVGNNTKPIVLASSESLLGKGCFLDGVISGPFALLGTTGGLLRVGNGNNIATAQGQDYINWTSIPIAESAGAINKFFVISPTNVHNDFATGGNIYVLNSWVSNHMSRVYRYSIDLDMKAPIDNTAITLFPDIFIKGLNTFFFNVGSYRNNVITDGAVIFLTQSKYAQEEPSVQLLRRNIRGGGDQTTATLRGSVFPVKAQGFFSLFNVVYNSGSGNWIVPGDFGIYSNE